jgi:magnesium transporter
MIESGEAVLGSVLENYLQLHPDDAAGQLEALPLEEAVRILLQVTPPTSAAVFERLSPQTASQVLEQIDDEVACMLLEIVDPSRTAPLLLRLGEEVRDRRLAGLSPRTAAELKTLMIYPPDTAGSLMDPRVSAFRPDATVEQVMERLRSLGRRRVHDILLVDGDGLLIGSIPLQDLVPAPRDKRLEELVRISTVNVMALATREEVVEILERHRLTTLPVVDIEGRLLGAIRYDALVRAVEQEASLDIQTMVGVSEDERALSKVSFAVRKRLPWLQINLATAFLAAAVVGIFEDTIAQFTALAVLLPVVAGQSGNTGAQALAVTMRGLTLREIRLRHWLRMIVKEAGVGLCNGVAVALVTSLGAYLWSGSAGIGLVIGLAMVISMALAGVSGAAIPMILSAVGQDPAQSSSIILTTVTDVTGFFSFLGLATLFSRLL